MRRMVVLDNFSPEKELSLYEKLLIRLQDKINSNIGNPEVLKRMVKRTKARIKELKNENHLD